MTIPKLQTGLPGDVPSPGETTSAAGHDPAAVFFAASTIACVGGSIIIGATQEGGWIALQVENTAGSIRVVLDEQTIDELILALAHQS